MPPHTKMASNEHNLRHLGVKIVFIWFMFLECVAQGPDSL